MRSPLNVFSEWLRARKEHAKQRRNEEVLRDQRMRDYLDQRLNATQAGKTVVLSRSEIDSRNSAGFIQQC